MRSEKPRTTKGDWKGKQRQFTQNVYGKTLALLTYHITSLKDEGLKQHVCENVSHHKMFRKCTLYVKDVINKSKGKNVFLCLQYYARN